MKRIAALCALLFVPGVTGPARPDQIDALKSPDASVRARAACALRDQGDRAVKAVPALIDLLPDATPVDPSVCHEQGSWWRGRPLEQTSPGKEAASALVAIGSASFQPLLAAATSPQWVARHNAVWALGALDDGRAVPTLMGSLKDTEAPVREQAAWALGAINDARAVDALVAALTDADPRVREQAAWALGAIDDARAVPGLTRALQDQSASVREQAAWALGAIGDQKAVDGLMTALKDAEAAVREQSAWALGAIGDPRASLALSSALKDANPKVRAQAAWALGAIGR